MSSFWKNKKVLVTGGGGFIGSHVVEKLVRQQARVTVMGSRSKRSMENLRDVQGKIDIYNGDCRNLSDALSACNNQEIVLNIAARVGGIAYNQAHQGTMFYDNMQIASTMLEAARQRKVERFLVVSSACVYPHDVNIPTPESDGFKNEPEPTNGGYGWAKRMAEKLGMYYSQEFGMKIAIARPYNCYGPRDHFEPSVSHVIPALIQRVLSGENPLVVWGSGRQTRAFLYVEDLADGLIRTIERYPQSDPVNLGTDEETSIQELIAEILQITGKTPKIIFDTKKPDGSPRRQSDNTKAKSVLSFAARTHLKDGLRKTIRWYLHTRPISKNGN